MASTYRLTLHDEEHELEVEEHDGSFRVRLGDEWYPLELERIGETARYSLLLNHRPYDVFAEEGPQGYHIVIGPRRFAITTPALASSSGAFSGAEARSIRCPRIGGKLGTWGS